jgi:glyoxylase-like metal-dependent hydrolase (beta-lactamase superfamily II)
MLLRIINIGALSSNPLWGEKPGAAVRTGHSTTTLIQAGKKNILVDPGLPAQALAQRLSERSPLRPVDITHVFLTSFRPDVWRGLPLFDHATWWITEAEREGMGVPLVRSLQQAQQQGDDQLVDALKNDIATLKRCSVAPDRLAEGVDIFPLPGVTPGMCGVLVAGPIDGMGNGTALICGDAIPTLEHLQRGSIPHGAADVETAQESFKEAIEIADFIVPGRDNWAVNPIRRGFGGGVA